LEDPKRKEPIVRGDTWVTDLCFHKDALHDTGVTGFVRFTPGGYFIGPRDGRVIALCENNGTLYDAGLYRGIYETHGSRKPVAKRNGHFAALHSHEGKLYDAVDLANGVKVGYICNDGIHSKIFETLTGKKVAEREGFIGGMISHNGVLFDFSGGEFKKGNNYTARGEIHETLTGKLLVYTQRGEITEMCGVDENIVKKILRNRHAPGRELATRGIEQCWCGGPYPRSRR